MNAAEKSYLQTARELGYEGADAQQWASAVMSHIWQAKEAEKDVTDSLKRTEGPDRDGDVV